MDIYCHAFAAPTTLAPRMGRANLSRCTCMAAKNTSGKKRTSKGKRPSNVASGFGPPKTSSKGSQSTDSDNSVQLEEASGSSGDATPHRATVDTPTFDKMKNPETDDSLDAPTDPLVELPQLTAEEKKKLRFDRQSTPDQLIEYFADARARDDFAAIITSNRDLITENVLYRFTSAILQVESRPNDIEQREEEARNMRKLRKDLIAHCWSYDFPLKVGVQMAEARLLNVLKGSNISQDVQRNCGRTSLDVSAFWIVIFAAVAAWEERGRENPELVDVDMQAALAAAADACRTLDSVKEYLSPSLQAVQEILGSSDPSVQTKVISELSEETIAELGCYTEQIRLLPTPAYGALVQRLRSIMDYILTARYNIDPQVLEPFRFGLPEVERQSRLVTFSRSSDAVKRRN